MGRIKNRFLSGKSKRVAIRVSFTVYHYVWDYTKEWTNQDSGLDARTRFFVFVWNTKFQDLHYFYAYHAFYNKHEKRILLGYCIFTVGTTLVVELFIHLS